MGRCVGRHASATVHLPEHRHPQGFRYNMLRPFETVFFLPDAHRRSAQPHLPRGPAPWVLDRLEARIGPGR